MAKLLLVSEMLLCLRRSPINQEIHIMLYKLLIVAILAAILISLFSGAIFLAKDDADSNRMVTSLTVRITLSILLVVVLLVGFMTGQIQPHGL